MGAESMVRRTRGHPFQQNDGSDTLADLATDFENVILSQSMPVMGAESIVRRRKHYFVTIDARDGRRKHSQTQKTLFSNFVTIDTRDGRRKHGQTHSRASISTK